ncbi:hypothetical protein [Mycoplasma feriruminatoris]|uniref:Uncharacterized protein n=1 Tax=Mycoplasma feriruminatoris TaxID=1179777 RepID=A0AAQ3HZR2_9MOLU|nr:hypothetical protein [Mycoplasma feriruminatoris]WFQ94905.1 hypothetical protein MFERI15407_00136 [Mycoplasma feriruminatoris]
MKKKIVKKNLALVKKKRLFLDFLKNNKLEDVYLKNHDFNKKSNILLNNFIIILKIHNLNYKNYWANISFMNFCIYYLYHKFYKSLSDQKLDQINKTINKIAKNRKYNSLEINYEKQLIYIAKQYEFKFSNEFINTYFNNHQIYNYISNSFSLMFEDDKKTFAYSYCYWLILFIYIKKYLSLELENKYSYSLFNLEMICNDHYIKNIRQLTLNYFNLLIIKNNKWISKLDVKRNKK